LAFQKLAFLKLAFQKFIFQKSILNCSTVFWGRGEDEEFRDYPFSASQVSDHQTVFSAIVFCTWDFGVTKQKSVETLQGPIL
jgi:hypothetical protein